MSQLIFLKLFEFACMYLYANAHNSMCFYILSNYMKDPDTCYIEIFGIGVFIPYLEMGQRLNDFLHSILKIRFSNSSPGFFSLNSLKTVKI